MTRLLILKADERVALAMWQACEQEVEGAGIDATIRVPRVERERREV